MAIRLFFRSVIANKKIIHQPIPFSQLIRSNQTSTNESIPSIDNDEPIEMENPYKREKQQCILCRLNIVPNYKNYRLLSQFQSPYTGRVYGRHITGLCKHKQRLVEMEIFKAQGTGYMPIMNKVPVFLRDPKLFDPERPIRPHKY